MAFIPFEDYRTDEQRAIEGIAALLDLTPPDLDEDPEHVARRMASWGVLQGPGVQWEAIWFVTHTMLQAQAVGVKFPQLAEVGIAKLKEYNRLNPKK